MTSALLVRYGHGWHEVLDSARIAAEGRREATLSLGDQESVAEVERVAAAQLRTEPREAISVDLEPISETDTPYLGFEVGDVISVPSSTGELTSERVVSITVAEDEIGTLTYAPDLKSVLLSADERFEQAIARVASGAQHGLSAVATPMPSRVPAAPIVAASTGPGEAWEVPAIVYYTGGDAVMPTTTDAVYRLPWGVGGEFVYEDHTPHAPDFFGDGNPDGIVIKRDGLYHVAFQVRCWSLCQVSARYEERTIVDNTETGYQMSYGPYVGDDGPTSTYAYRDLAWSGIVVLRFDNGHIAGDSRLSVQLLCDGDPGADAALSSAAIQCAYYGDRYFNPPT